VNELRVKKLQGSEKLQVQYGINTRAGVISEYRS